MSRYHALSLKYVAFCAKSRQAESIAKKLADAVSSLLGAPAETVFPRPVVWGGEGWSLASIDEKVPRFHRDGRFYFAVCIRLGSQHDADEAQLFATLLSARAAGNDTEVRLEDTDPKFSVYLSDPSAQEDLVGEIIGVVEDALDPDPSGEPPPLKLEN